MKTRRSFRLPNYDYSQNGAYFITICTQNHQLVFGPPNTDTFQKEILSDIIEFLDNQSPHLNVLHYVIMPNHIHLILLKTGNTADDVSTFVRKLKTFATKKLKEEYNRRKLIFPSPLWQGSFHDRIIRNETEFENTWKYIDNNPLKWELDKYYRHLDFPADEPGGSSLRKE